MFLAHIRQESDKTKIQSLESHLFNTAKLAAKIGAKINQQNITFLLGLFHDLGKADRLFQTKLKVNPEKKVNHSSAGAYYLYNFGINNFKYMQEHYLNNKQSLKYFSEFMDIITYCISAHHDVYDVISPFASKNYLKYRILYVDRSKNNYEEDVLPFASHLEKILKKKYKLSYLDLFTKAFEDYQRLSEKLDSQDESENDFYNTLKVRLYLSILKNADIFDTINAYELKLENISSEELKEKKYQYLENVENKYKQFAHPQSRINAVRNQIATKVKLRGQKDSTGIYKLNLPTGAGKTLVSTRYAVEQMVHKNKDRFIYITAFLSVLEQNSAAIKAVLKDKDILEHHSNIVNANINRSNSLNEDNSDIENEYLLQSWDAPVVLSTMVQFFQTLFKVKSDNLRRFTALINSVIVLDEVQSLPINVTYLFNLSLNFISKVMGATIVLCTATQPRYNSSYIEHKLNYGGENKEDIDLIKLSSAERNVFKRNEVYKFSKGEAVDAQTIAKEVLAYPEESILVILNTKHAVAQVFEALKNQTSRKVYYLSTNLCPKHRQDLIAEMKQRITKEKIICVSTQVIEAGVDIDFDRLIRSYAGIDSMVQAMGRVNREGKLEDKGTVKLAKPMKSLENLDYLPYIKDKAQTTAYILSDAKEPIDIESLNDLFYEKYYANNSQKMYYPIEKDFPSAYELLSTNKSLVISYRNNVANTRLKQAFATAARNINLIADDTEGVIVYYQESYQLIEELIALINQYEDSFGNDLEVLYAIKMYLRKLQPYTVNLYNLEKYEEAIMEYMDGDIKILTSAYYDDEIGITNEVGVFLF